MKKYLYFCLIMAVQLCGCARSHSGAETADAADSIEVEVNKLVAPLPMTLSLDNLSDATVPASFSADDFRWMGGDVALTVYEELLYDAVEVCSLSGGDTLLYQEQEMLIVSLMETNGALEINGGFEEGGATLCPYEGGTYRAVVSDNHSVYRLVGTARLSLHEDFTIHDAGEFPQDPITLITDAQKPYLDMLEGARREFSCLNTRVTIENGLITDITRRWIP